MAGPGRNPSPPDVNEWPTNPEAAAKGSDIGDVVLLLLIAASVVGLLLLLAWLLPLMLDNVLLGRATTDA